MTLQGEIEKSDRNVAAGSRQTAPAELDEGRLEKGRTDGGRMIAEA